jgi:hypothetical protein
MTNKRWADFLYTETGNEADPCIYCGSPSNHWDHIPPIHFITRLLQLDIIPHNTLQKVRACEECNLALSGNILITIKERKRFLFNYYFGTNKLRIKAYKIGLIKRKCRRCGRFFVPSKFTSNSLYCDPTCRRADIREQGKRYRQAYKNRRRQLRLAGVPAPLLVALRTHFYGKGTS